MRTIIIDDEREIREGLKIILQKTIDIQVVGEANDVESGKLLIDYSHPKLVFLDIRLNNQESFDLLDQLQHTNFHLIFITAFHEYAIKAFKYNAFDYLLKPIDPFELIKTLERIRKIHNPFTQHLIANVKENHELNKLVIKTTEKIHIIAIKTIIRCQADQGYTYFYINNGKRILSSKNLKEYSQLLSDRGFLRVHQSHLVNVNYIKEMNKLGHLLLMNGTYVPVSIRNKSKVVKILINLK